ncbi:hypothetical protein ACOMHN_034483 [Nucella lapillus]
MPQGQYVSFAVFTTQKLPEYMIRNKVYTEVSLHGPSSFILEEDSQKYPVVPFAVNITRHCEQVVWIKLFLDGQFITSRPLVRTKFQVDGVKVGNEIRQLLFSLPKMTDDQEKKNPLGEFAGTIRLEVGQAACMGQTSVPVFETYSAFSSNNQANKLYHLTKKDISSFYKRDATGNIVSREGKPTLNITKTSKFRQVYKYRQIPDTPLEEILLYYRPHVTSHIPKIPTHPVIKQENEEEQKPRVPLSDLSNTATRQVKSDGEKMDGENSKKMDGENMDSENMNGENMNGEHGSQSSTDLAENLGNMAIKSGEAASHCEQKGVQNCEPSERSESSEQQSVTGPENGWSRERQVELMETGDMNSNASEGGPNTAGDSGLLTEHSSTAGDSGLLTEHSSTAGDSGLLTEHSHGVFALDVKHGDSSDAVMTSPVKVKQRDSCPSALVPPMNMNIKTRESCETAMIPPMNIKQRESCGSAMVPPVNIHQQVSCASPMIPLEKIKQRASCGFAMIPPVDIKHCKSCESALIPLETIKKRESCGFAMVPPMTIKQRASCGSALTPPEQTEEPSGDSQAEIDEKKDIVDDKEETIRFVLVDESDSEDEIIFMFEEEDERCVYIKAEEDVDEDSIICMGDDDCYFLDVSNHDTVVEINDTIIEPE